MLEIPEGYDARTFPLTQPYSAGISRKQVIRSNLMRNVSEPSHQRAMDSRLLWAQKYSWRGENIIFKYLSIEDIKSKSESADPHLSISNKPSPTPSMDGEFTMAKQDTIVIRQGQAMGRI